MFYTKATDGVWFFTTPRICPDKMGNLCRLTTNKKLRRFSLLECLRTVQDDRGRYTLSHCEVGRTDDRSAVNFARPGSLTPSLTPCPTEGNGAAGAVSYAPGTLARVPDDNF